MLTVINNNCEVVSPTDELLEWAKRELEFPNPDFAKKRRMGFSTRGCPSVIRLYETKPGKLILPYGCCGDVLKYDSALADHVREREAQIVHYGGKVPLRGYQQKAVTKAMMYRCGILQAPAGSGKTQMGIAMIMRAGLKALWITHTKDLLNQSKERAMLYMDKSLIGTITEGKCDIGKGVTFATVQTLCRMDLNQLQDEWDMIIVDECHRVAGTPTSVTMFSRVLNSLAAFYKYGLSATVHRADGLIKATYAFIGPVIARVSDSEVADSVEKVRLVLREVNCQIGDCYNTDGTLNYTRAITSLSENERRNSIIIDDIEYEVQCGASCLVLSSRLEQLKGMLEILGDDAVMIDGSMTSKRGKAQREKAIEDMRSGKKKVLLASYNLAKEGLDIPRLSALFMATPVTDEAVVIQSLGRVARKFDGKQQPVCYDYVDVNIPHCVAQFKKRRRVYKKANCYET